MDASPGNRARQPTTRNDRALGAVYAAMDSAGRVEPVAVPRTGAVVAETRFLGRDYAGGVPAVRSEEGLGVSPHLMSHNALHRPRGSEPETGDHGTNLGRRGMTRIQGFLMEMTWLTAGTVPGVG